MLLRVCCGEGTLGMCSAQTLSHCKGARACWQFVILLGAHAAFACTVFGKGVIVAACLLYTADASWCHGRLGIMGAPLLLAAAAHAAES